MQENNFNVTDNAAKRIEFLLRKERDYSKLRISVQAGGCSGFQYKYDFVVEDNENDDILIEKLGARVIIDDTSMNFLQGSQLDYIENLGGAYFEIKNPNAASKCGCGNSFTV